MSAAAGAGSVGSGSAQRDETAGADWPAPTGLHAHKGAIGRVAPAGAAGAAGSPEHERPEHGFPGAGAGSGVESRSVPFWIRRSRAALDFSIPSRAET